MSRHNVDYWTSRVRVLSDDNVKLQRASDDQLRVIASLVKQLGGTALIPVEDLMEDDVAIASIQEFDGVRLHVR